jgi:NADPH2:quinone reductase
MQHPPLSGSFSPQICIYIDQGTIRRHRRSGPLRTEAFGLLAPFGRHIVLGNASGEDPVISGDAAWHGTRQLSGLSLGGVAHLIPGKVAAALAAVTELLHRGSLREPPPAVRPFDQVIEVHRALENRSAPAKTVLAIHG